MDDIIDFRSRFEPVGRILPRTTPEERPHDMAAQIVSLDAHRFPSENPELDFALDLARDVPLVAALQTAQERPDDRRALMVAVFAAIGALATLPRR